MASNARPASSILLLEDDAKLRDELLLPGLADYGFSAVGVGTAAAFYDRLRTQAFNLVVLDVDLPDADGFSVAQAIRGIAPGIGIIMLTAHGAAADQVRGLNLGADAYLVKPAQFEILAATMHSLLRRLGGMPTPQPASRWQYDSDQWCMISPQGRSVLLTKAEQQLVAKLAETPGQMVTRDQLMSAVADEVHDFDPRRIDMVIYRLRRKALNRCGEALPLISAYSQGYILYDEPVAEA